MESSGDNDVLALGSATVRIMREIVIVDLEKSVRFRMELLDKRPT